MTCCKYYIVSNRCFYTFSWGKFILRLSILTQKCDFSFKSNTKTPTLFENDREREAVFWVLSFKE